MRAIITRVVNKYCACLRQHRYGNKTKGVDILLLIDEKMFLLPD